MAVGRFLTQNIRFKGIRLNPPRGVRVGIHEYKYKVTNNGQQECFQKHLNSKIPQPLSNPVLRKTMKESPDSPTASRAQKTNVVSVTVTEKDMNVEDLNLQFRIVMIDIDQNLTRKETPKAKGREKTPMFLCGMFHF